jgi:hypothetical protein
MLSTAPLTLSLVGNVLAGKARTEVRHVLWRGGGVVERTLLVGIRIRVI